MLLPTGVDETWHAAGGNRGTSERRKLSNAYLSFSFYKLLKFRIFLILMYIIYTLIIIGISFAP